MEQVIKGFLFSLGFFPVIFISVWIFHNWPLSNSDFEGIEDLAFDKSQIEPGEMSLKKTEAGFIALAEVRNNSDVTCGFLQLDCDLVHGKKIIVHGIEVVSNLGAKSKRGYSVHFDALDDSWNMDQLKVNVSIAQAFTIED